MPDNKEVLARYIRVELLGKQPGWAAQCYGITNIQAWGLVSQNYAKQCFGRSFRSVVKRRRSGISGHLMESCPTVLCPGALIVGTEANEVVDALQGNFD